MNAVSRNSRQWLLRGLALILVGLVSSCQSQAAPTVVPALTPATQPQPTLAPVTAGALTTTAPTSPAPTAAVATASAGATFLPSPVASGAAVLLFGPFNLPPQNFGPPFTGAFTSLRIESAKATLDAARSAGFHLIVNLAGGRSRYQDAAKAFSPALFKQRLEPFRVIDFGSYVADGTVIGHMMFDEPHDPTNWNGQPVPFEDIETAAGYSKALWPTMPVGVGGPPDFLQGAASWHSLDFAFAPYTTQKGSADQWLKRQVQASQQTGLGLALGINVLQGNNRGPVTAEQLTTWGTLFASEPRACALLMWKHDPAYFAGPGMAEAVAAVTEVSKHHPAVPCRP